MWIYHSTLSTTADGRDLFLYAFASSATTPTPKFAVVKRVKEKEARVHTKCAAGKNTHNIIQIFDCIPLDIDIVKAHSSPSWCFSPTQKDSYLVMEHATGGTLHELLARTLPSSLPPTFPWTPPKSAEAAGVGRKKLPAWFCYHFLAEILDAVIRMHTRDGVIHIDLHIKNVMFQKRRHQGDLDGHEQRAPVSSLSTTTSSNHPNEAGNDDDEKAAIAIATATTTTTQHQQQQKKPSWAIPIIKIIDFGRVHELPPTPAQNDDDEKSSSQWENKPNYSVGILVRRMTAKAYIGSYEPEVYAFLEPLAVSQVSIQTLREAQTVAEARKGVDVCVPQWLREYFR